MTDEQMIDKPTVFHSLERTSPLGSKFEGKCVLCGKENLTAADINERCGNTNGTTQDEALLRAMEPEQ